EETAYTYVPRQPSAYILDDDLYNKIILNASASLFPRYTLLKQRTTYFIPLKTDDKHIQRGLFFPWIKLVSERLIIS
ncbi:cell division protein FtsK, partial [Streptococcus suis]